MKRQRRTNVLAVFCALTSVFLILHGCGGGGDGGGGGPVAVTYGISGQATLTGSGLSGVTMALSGVSSGNAITDASGNYAFTGLDNGSYTITPSKTGFTFSPTSSSQTVSGANITGVNFIATPVASAFSQTDLTGTWEYINISIGFPEWIRSVFTINGSGGVTFTSSLSSSGDTSVPPPTDSGTFTISSAGVISVPGDTVHFQMSSNKLLIFGTDHGANPNWADITVIRKRTGTAFGSADLANKTFTNHWLDIGTDNAWGYAAGTTDASGLATITSRWFPSGPDSPPYSSPGTLSVSSVGIVTLSGVPTFYGLMTDDKKVIFYIATTGINSYEFGVITITGQTYTQSDYAGTWNFNTIRNAPIPGWGYGVISYDAAGTGTYLSYTDSVGGAIPASISRILSASGVITDPADATYNGQMSYNKNINVHTNTNASGRSGLTIGFK
jgi:hypothetical protein